MTYPKILRRHLYLRNAVTVGLLGVMLSGCGSSATGRSDTTPVAESTTTRDNRQLVDRGREAMRRGDSIRAEHYFSLAIERGYEKAELLPELLAVCLSSSRLRSALNYAEPYLRQHPKDSALRYLVATVHLGLGQSDSAKQELKTVLRHDPAFTEAHFLLGMLEFADEPASAKQHLSTYLEFRPNGDKSSEARERLEQSELEPKTEKAVVRPQRIAAEALSATSPESGPTDEVEK